MSEVSNSRETVDRERRENSLYVQRVRVLAQKAVLDQVDAKLQKQLIKEREAIEPQN